MNINLSIETVIAWGQRLEPEPQTAIYQDVSQYSLNHNWVSTPKAHSRVGIYLGNNLVACVSTKDD